MFRLRSVGGILAAAILSALVPTIPAVAADGLVRGVYGRDSSPGGLDIINSTGFNAVTAMPNRVDLDAIAAKGMRAIVWLGEYHRTKACDWEWSDDYIRQVVSDIEGHPAIYAYQLSDEPTYARVQGCDAVADHKARSDLIHSIDPTKPTYVTLTTWDGQEGYPYAYWVDAADVFGLVTYPCSHEWDTWDGCQFNMIDEAISEAKSDGLGRYIAVMQEFEDGWYRVPTADELRTQFERWAGSGMEGYFLYHWNIADVESRPDHLAVMAEANGIGEPQAEEPDVTAPSPPRRLIASKRVAGIYLDWKPATDDRGVVAYEIVRNGIKVASFPVTHFEDRQTIDGPRAYEVRAVDAAGNRSDAATVIVAIRSKASLLRNVSRLNLDGRRYRGPFI